MSRVAALDPEQLLRNAYPQVARQRKYRDMPLWVFVSLISGNGSAVSAEICRELGWNPEQRIGDKLPPRRSAGPRSQVQPGVSRAA